MFPMQNFEPESAVISAASNSALIEKYLRNTCLGQGAVLIPAPSCDLVTFFLQPGCNKNLPMRKSTHLLERKIPTHHFPTYTQPIHQDTTWLPNPPRCHLAS